MNFRAGWKIAGLMVLSPWLLGASVSGTVGPTLPLDRDVDTQFSVGASRVDLTPIPGIPMGGYSSEGRLPRGHWMRIFARAIYIEEGSATAGQSREAMVLVATDLMIIPTGLAERVAEVVNQEIPTLGRANIVLTATENHLGPGNYFTSDFYNYFSSPKAGFDDDLFDFLVRRIRQAIVEAHGAAEPATMRIGSKAVADLFRNRSLEAFQLNENASEFTEGNSLGECPSGVDNWNEHDYPPGSCEAVYPEVDVVSFHRIGVQEDSVIAVGVFLGAHTTVMGPKTEVYSGDLFGAVSLMLENGWQGPNPTPGEPVEPCPTGTNPVVGVFNGAGGDVSVWWRTRDRRDIKQLGTLMADAICELLPGIEVPSSPLAYEFVEFDPITGRQFLDPTQFPDGFERQIPPKPKIGAAKLGGAPDGRSQIPYDVGLRSGLQAPERSDHGSMHSLEIGIGRLSLNIGEQLMSEYPPPTKAPLGIYRIGPVVFVTAPAEITTMMGERIRRAALAPFDIGDDARAILVGFAHGHISYITTPAEFDAQYYEGASNYNGAQTGAWLEQRYSEIAHSLVSQDGDREPSKPHSFGYSIGDAAPFDLRDVGAPAYWVDDGLRNIVQDESNGLPKRDFPMWCWVDAIPALEKVGDDPHSTHSAVSDERACKRAVPYVEVRDADGNPVTNNHSDVSLVTVAESVAKDRAEWCAIWLNEHVLAEGPYTIHVERLTGGSVDSDPFADRPNRIRACNRSFVAPHRSAFWCHKWLRWLPFCKKLDTCSPPGDDVCT